METQEIEGYEGGLAPPRMEVSAAVVLELDRLAADHRLVSR